MAKKENNDLEKRNQAFLIYQDENGIARVNVRFEGEDVWLNVEQMTFTVPCSSPSTHRAYNCR